MDFGLYIRPGNTFEGMLELAEFADQNNYWGVFINDHIQSFTNKGNDPFLEAWTAMTGIGVLTKHVRIGHIVLFNSLRNPAYLAKSIATLDNMIKGRYECLIGAGWNKVEYEGYDLMEQGRGMPPAKERVDRFEEALQIIKGMLTQPSFSFEGKFWHLKEAKNVPQPFQKNMRISVGAQKPRMLQVTAKYADGLNIASGIDKYEKIINEMKSYLEKNNKDPQNFFFSGFHSVYLCDNNDSYQTLVKDLSKSMNKPRDWVEQYSISGTPEMVVEKLQKLKDIGLKMTVIVPRKSTTSPTKEEVLDMLTKFTDQVKPYF